MSNRQPRADARANAPRGFSRFRHILAACIATRLAIDTTTQLFFPFLQTVALGLSLDIVVLGRLVSLRSLAGLSAPLFGSAADRYGYRRIMRLSLLLTAAGMFLLGSGAGIWSVVAGMIVSGAGADRLLAHLSGLYQRATALRATRTRHWRTGILLGIGRHSRPAADGLSLWPLQLATPLLSPRRGNARQLGFAWICAGSDRRSRT